jgi:hypothetical protein
MALGIDKPTRQASGNRPLGRWFVSSDGREVSEIMGNLLPDVSEASVSAGASGFRFDPE